MNEKEAREVYDEAIGLAWEVYNKARALAREAYDKAREEKEENGQTSMRD